MATIYAFKNFNNYYNRRLCGQDVNDIQSFTVAYKDYDYMQSGTYDNFNSGDGVQARHILGLQSNPYYGDCDYLIYCADNVNITSRWYIVDQNKKCFGQFEINLFRDVLADHWEQILKADCFIEKATLRDDDPLIFNQEAITTNLIKKAEVKLFDESKCQWIVGYMNKAHHKNEATTITVNANADVDFSATSMAGLETIIGTTKNVAYKKITNAIYNIKIYKPVYRDNQIIRYHFMTFAFNTQNNLWYKKSDEWVFTTPPTGSFVSKNTESEILECLNDYVYNTILKNSYTWDSTYSESDYNKVINAEGKIGEVTTGVNQGYYKVIVENSTSEITLGESTNNDDLYLLLLPIRYSGSPKIKTASITYSYASYNLESVAFGEYSVTLGAVSDRLHCGDSFDMFVIPYKDTVIKNTDYSGEWTDIALKKEVAMSTAQGLAIALDSNLYDLQILPYNPLSGLVFNHTLNTIDIKAANTNRYRIVTDSSSQPVCIILWATSNSNSKNITVTGDIFSVNNVKINNQCDMLRIVSPNYNGQYELNVARNGGINSFKIDFTYIPYRPYIHVAPLYNANGIYGEHNDDATGLICGGDFSISYLSSAWEKYVTENKNYTDIFDRGTQNLDTNYKYQRLESYLSAGVGAISSGVAGGIINPIMGVLGGVASAAGGIADLTIQQRLHSEAMDYRKDLFQMQLDNIKALPYSLTKVSTININNKGVPFVEYFSCTEREKIATAEKIAWNGMTVGVIGKISDYIVNTWRYGEIEDKGYIKAKLIRLEGIDDETHLVNAIANELFQGVYTK